MSVIVHRSASDKLAVVHSSCLFGAEYYSGQRERIWAWKNATAIPKKELHCYTITVEEIHLAASIYVIFQHVFKPKPYDKRQVWQPLLKE